jgi:prevent-host-death family protein
MYGMSEQHSIAEASNHLADLVQKAEEGKTVELTREGERVAVLLGSREYERLTGRPRKDFWEALQEFRRTADFEAIGDPDEVWGDVRDPDPGRDVNL